MAEKDIAQISKLSGLEQNLNVSLLKSIHDKCVTSVRSYEGKPISPLFGVDVNLNASEIGEVKKLIGLAKISLAELTQDQRFHKLEILIKDGVNKGVLMSFTEIPRWLVEDSKATDAYKTRLSDGTAAIAAPPDIRNLWISRSKVENLEKDLNRYEKGLAKGTSATYLGKEVRDSYVFVKENYSIIESKKVSP